MGAGKPGAISKLVNGKAIQFKGEFEKLMGAREWDDILGALDDHEVLEIKATVQCTSLSSQRLQTWNIEV